MKIAAHIALNPRQNAKTKFVIKNIQSVLKYWKNYHVDHQQKNPHNYRLFK